MPATNRVTILMTDDEFGEVKERAGIASVSAYIKSVLFPNGGSYRLPPGTMVETDNPKAPSKGDFEDAVEVTVARKNGHELGCKCVGCARLRAMMRPKGK